MRVNILAMRLSEFNKWRVLPHADKKTVLTKGYISLILSPRVFFCVCSILLVDPILRYFVPQVPITGKMLNGYLMFSGKNIIQNVKLNELWGIHLAPLHFVISKS